MTGGRFPPGPVDVGPGGLAEHLGGPRVEVAEALVDRLRDDGVAVSSDPAARAEAARDWWPLSIAWAARGQVPAQPAVVARPTDTAGVASVLRRCNDARVPVTPTAGASGVCGGSVPVFGGVSLDLTGLSGLYDLDEPSLLADVGAGTFGPELEAALSATGTGYTLGHWPQSMDISTVGGWIACRGAGQYSTRYGKIEDLVVGLEVVLADGTVVTHRRGGAALGDRPQPHPAVPGQRGHPGGGHRGPAPRHPAPGRRGPARPRLRLVRRRARRLPPDPASRGDPGRAPPLRHHRVATELRRRDVRAGRSSTRPTR